MNTNSFSNANRLFQNKQWRGKLLPSRVVLAPINTGFARNGRPTAKLLRYHVLRSGPAIGINMVGNVAIDHDSTTNSQTTVLSEEIDIRRLAVIARSIKKSGSLAGIQLACTLPGLFPSRKWKTIDVGAETKRLQALILSIDENQLSRYMSRFQNSAELAARAGYDVVQIHAAHGYLLSLLINPTTNRRKDYYSAFGPWLISFVERLRNSIKESLLSFRLSLFSGLSSVSEETAIMGNYALLLATAGTDIIDISAGAYTVDRGLIYPGHEHESPPLYPPVRELANTIPGLVSVAGKVIDLRTIPSDIPENLLVSVGRAMIADPEFALKSRESRFAEIRHCALKGHCHYFTRGKFHIECGVNPEL